MPDQQFSNPIGIDGRQLIENAYSTFHIWSWSEIYFGPQTPETGIYVPKKGDLILKKDEGKFYEVVQLDPNFIPTVRDYYLTPPSEEDGSLLMGVGVGTQSDLFRMYVNKTTMPYSAVIDQRLWVGGSDTSYAIVYRGSPTTNGVMEVISLLYDTNSSVILGNEIPLESISGPNYVNCWTVKPFYTKIDLQDNEFVTVIFYNSQNTPVARSLLLVENTAWIRDQTDSLKYIKDIFLESPFISSSDPNLIRYPLNLPRNALNLFGVVLYSDGSQKRYPVNGGKFSMLGLGGFVATFPNQTDQWVLRYQVDQNEAVEGAVVGEHHYMTKPFDVQVTQVTGMYSVKLFCFPVWRDPINGYTLKWFLYTLDRDVWTDVTPYVHVGGNSQAFDPILYGVNQQISWVIEMNNVNPAYGNWTHTQVINISLMRQGTENVFPRWTVRDQGVSEPYGDDIVCEMEFVNQNYRTLNFGSGKATRQEWLNSAYYKLNPLYDSYAETQAIEPDYFVLSNGQGGEVVVNIDNWNEDIIVNFTVDPDKTLFVHFFKTTADNELQLAAGGWTVRQIN